MHSVNAPTLHYKTEAQPTLAEYVLQRVSLYAQRRIIWLRHLWQAVATQSEGTARRHMEIDGYLWQIDNAEDEFNFYSEEKECIAVTGRIDELEAAGRENVSLKRYRQLVQTLRLNEYEEDAVQLCYAADADPDLARILAYLHNDTAKGYITHKLVAQLFGHQAGTTLIPDSPLLKWKLMNEAEPAKLEIDKWFRHWLSGFEGLDDLLEQYSIFQTPEAPHSSWPLHDTVSQIVSYIRQHATPMRLLLTGTINSGRKTFASCICAMLNKRMLLIDNALIPPSQHRATYRNAQRLALLTNTVSAWQHVDFNERFETYNLPSAHLQVFIGENGDRLMPDSKFKDVHVELPLLSEHERRQAWTQFVPAFSAWSEEEKLSLVQNHQSPLGTIVHAGRLGCDLAKDALQIVKTAQVNQLGELAHEADAAFSFDDLIISAQVRHSLNDFCFEARERLTFWEIENNRRLFPQGRSLVGLFSGSPGTGKTMAAQVIANSLSLSLYRVDLSSVISKYIGESAKNLNRILNRASQMNIVLLFDEADALFGKRTEAKDAHDRYANSDTNYLLQAIEEYSGIVILSTNRKSNIDPAFLRRFRYVIEFPRPEPLQRKAIWENVIRGLCDDQQVQNMQQVIDKLAQSFELTGAQIKLSVLSAVFMAKREQQTLQAKHILRGIEREVAKEGKALGRDLQNLF